jgi:hypothetical protein
MIKNKFSIWVCGFVLTALMACEHNVSMETTVHPDGQLDKTIYLEVEQKQKKLKESFIHFIDTIQLNEWQALDSAEIPAYLKPVKTKNLLDIKNILPQPKKLTNIWPLKTIRCFGLPVRSKKNFDGSLLTWFTPTPTMLLTGWIIPLQIFLRLKIFSLSIAFRQKAKP